MSHPAFKTASGEIWTSAWVGDNAGRYEWATADGRLVVWCDSRRFEDDPARGGRRAVHVYRATLDGYASTITWPTLLDAMAEAVRSRHKLDMRRAAA